MNADQAAVQPKGQFIFALLLPELYLPEQQAVRGERISRLLYEAWIAQHLVAAKDHEMGALRFRRLQSPLHRELVRRHEIGHARPRLQARRLHGHDNVFGKPNG